MIFFQDLLKLFSTKFVRFLFAGAVNTIFGYGLYIFLVEMQIPYLISLLIANMGGIIFKGLLRAEKPAAAVMSLIQSANMNGHESYAYMKDVLTRLPTQKNSRFEEFCLIAGNPLRGNTNPTKCDMCSLYAYTWQPIL